jgi:hypothetical protein
MTTLHLSDAPPFITNMGSILSVVLDMLHEVDFRNMSDDDRTAFLRSIGLLTVANEACEFTVRAIEAGLDYKIGGGA